MKYVLSDADGVTFEVGYDVFEGEPLFWLEAQPPAQQEVITLHLKPEQLRELIEKMIALGTEMELRSVIPATPPCDEGAEELYG